MKQNYLLYREFEVHCILPSLKREYAKAFVSLGYSYEKAGKEIAVSKAAVCQYLHGKRANVPFPKWLKDLIKESAEAISMKEAKTIDEFRRILNIINEHLEIEGKL